VCSHLANLIEIEIGYDQFILVLAAFDKNAPVRI
jgi:hypothetical protein